MKALICLFAMCFMIQAVASDFKKSKKIKPTREHSIIVTNEGYYPSQISLFKGEKLRIFVSTTEQEIGCLMMPSHDLFISANPGKINSGEITFDEPGQYEFFCPSNKIKGRVTVLSRKKKDENRRPATVTSQRKVWMPKDF